MQLGMKIRLIWAAVGISAGLMAGTVFWISYKVKQLFSFRLIISIFCRIIWLFYWLTSVPSVQLTSTIRIGPIISHGCLSGVPFESNWHG
jgi:hypothetical protein